MILSLERQEKTLLREKLSGQAETVHQLSLHVQLLMVCSIDKSDSISFFRCIMTRGGKTWQHPHHLGNKKGDVYGRADKIRMLMSLSECVIASF